MAKYFEPRGWDGRYVGGKAEMGMTNGAGGTSEDGRGLCFERADFQMPFWRYGVAAIGSVFSMKGDGVREM